MDSNICGIGPAGDKCFFREVGIAAVFDGALLKFSNSSYQEINYYSPVTFFHFVVETGKIFIHLTRMVRGIKERSWQRQKAAGQEVQMQIQKIVEIVIIF